jgi:hypothetical protein
MGFAIASDCRGNLAYVLVCFFFFDKIGHKDATIYESQQMRHSFTISQYYAKFVTWARSHQYR